MTRMLQEEDIKKRQEMMSRMLQEREMMSRMREEKEMMDLIQAEQMRQSNSEQVITPQTNGSEMVENSQQDVIGQLQKEVEMLKKKMYSSNTGENAGAEGKSVPARSGIKYRLGVAARLGDPQQIKIIERLGDGDKTGQIAGERFDEDWSTSHDNVFDNQLCPKTGRKRKYENYELPRDLVLTELSDKGPVPARASGGIARELVLTEFGEKGPVKVTSEWEKLEARPRKVAKKN